MMDTQHAATIFTMIVTSCCCTGSERLPCCWHVRMFNGPFTGTTLVSQYQKGKTNLDFTKVSGSGISWAICKSAPRSRQIIMLAPHHSVSYRPDALPATQPTASALKALLLTPTWYFIYLQWVGRCPQNCSGSRLPHIHGCLVASCSKWHPD